MSLIPIPPDKAPAMVGKGVHVRWANKACVWILKEIVGDKATLVTPKSRKTIRTKTSDLCYTRQNEPNRPPPQAAERKVER